MELNIAELSPSEQWSPTTPGATARRARRQERLEATSVRKWAQMYNSMVSQRVLETVGRIPWGKAVADDFWRVPDRGLPTKWRGDLGERIARHVWSKTEITHLGTFSKFWENSMGRQLWRRNVFFLVPTGEFGGNGEGVRGKKPRICIVGAKPTLAACAQ